MKIKKIVSGGQTGVDLAGLDAGLLCGIPVGGYAPAHFQNEQGDISGKYNLKPAVCPGYDTRTFLNVYHSDATLIINRGKLAGGTLMTYGFCEQIKKPVLIIEIGGIPDIILAQTIEFIERVSPATLNIAGPRESKCPGIYEAARGFLEGLFGNSRL